MKYRPHDRYHTNFLKIYFLTFVIHSNIYPFTNTYVKQVFLSGTEVAQFLANWGAVRTGFFCSRYSYCAPFYFKLQERGLASWDLCSTLLLNSLNFEAKRQCVSQHCFSDLTFAGIYFSFSFKFERGDHKGRISYISPWYFGQIRSSFAKYIVLLSAKRKHAFIKL